MPSSRAVVRVPTASAIRKSGGFSMTGSKNNPPCGAGHPQPSKIVMNPASALPAMQARLTRSGSRSANGSAPSVTKRAAIALPMPRDDPVISAT